MVIDAFPVLFQQIIGTGCKGKSKMMVAGLQVIIPFPLQLLRDANKIGCKIVLVTGLLSDLYNRLPLHQKKE